MSNVIDRLEYNGLVIEVVPDDNPMDPREWDNVGTMVCFHKRYSLGDKTSYRSEDYESWQELYTAIEENGGIHIQPLYLYDHSGISIRIGSWHGRAPHAEWDSGQVGFIYTTKKELDNYGITDTANAIEGLQHEVEEYDRYLRGDVYGYLIKKACQSCEHLGVEDSSWGFSSTEEAFNHAKENCG
jgi:hypothetical protein